MKNILTFGASNSIHSINKKLAIYTAHQMRDVEITVLDLNDFEMPIYSIDREQSSGIPELAVQFKNHLKASDGIIISFAEHNGSYSTAFKNIMDWISRLEGSIWEDKPMFLLSTSPGGRGGKSVLASAVNSFKFMSKGSLNSFSLPSFQNNFSEEEGILDEALKLEFERQLKAFSEQ